jgi:hypothetical protein
MRPKQVLSLVAVGLLAAACEKNPSDATPASAPTHRAASDPAAAAPPVAHSLQPALSPQPALETDFGLSPRINCAIKEDGLQVISETPPRVTAITVNRTPAAGYCEVLVSFDVTNTENSTRAHQLMRRVVWLEIGESADLAFNLPPKWRVNEVEGLPVPSAELGSSRPAALERILAAYNPKITCAVKDGGQRTESASPPNITALTVNRSAAAGYCDLVMRLDLTDTTTGAGTHQVMRRVVWLEIGEESKLAFELPRRFRLELAETLTP